LPYGELRFKSARDTMTSTSGALMLRNLFLFSILTMLFGNPLIAILIIVAFYLAIDVRYFGITRRVIKRIQDEPTIRLPASDHFGQKRLTINSGNVLLIWE
jgi:hypothetical protein